MTTPAPTSPSSRSTPVIRSPFAQQRPRRRARPELAARPHEAVDESLHGTHRIGVAALRFQDDGAHALQVQPGKPLGPFVPRDEPRVDAEPLVHRDLLLGGAHPLGGHELGEPRGFEASVAPDLVAQPMEQPDRFAGEPGHDRNGVEAAHDGGAPRRVSGSGTTPVQKQDPLDALLLQKVRGAGAGDARADDHDIEMFGHVGGSRGIRSGSTARQGMARQRRGSNTSEVSPRTDEKRARADAGSPKRPSTPDAERTSHRSFTYGTPSALGGTARPMKPARSTTVST